MTVTATLFLVVAIMHLVPIIFGWRVEIGGLNTPFWVSWLGVLVAVPSHTSASRGTDSRPPVATNRSTMPSLWALSLRTLHEHDIFGSEDEIQHIRGLGFIGLLVSGSHHQPHHLAIAKGEFDHEHLGHIHSNSTWSVSSERNRHRRSATLFRNILVATVYTNPPSAGPEAVRRGRDHSNV